MNCLSFSETTSSAGLMRAYSIAGKAARRRFAFDPWCGGCALTGGGRFENPRANARGRGGGGRLGGAGLMRAYSIAGKAARRRFAFDPWCGGCALTGGGRFENPRDNPRGRVGGGRLGDAGRGVRFLGMVRTNLRCR